MDLVKCEAFLSAVDCGSFTAAAESLGYTQSGITRMINSLEAEVGFPLFIRSKKGVVLTENGQMLLPAFRDIAHAHKNAEQLSADIRGFVKGSLSIGSYFSISSIWMPDILSRFMTLYPGIKVNLREGGNLEMSRWLNESSVDCCFCAEPSGDTNCDWLPLFRDELVVWLPKAHPKAGAEKFVLSELENEPFIMTSPSHDTDQDRLLEEANLHPDICLSTKDGYSTYNMVAAGLGISFNQRLISSKWDASVVELPFEPPKYVSLGIAVPVVRESSPATKKFIECAKEIITLFQKSNNC